jgi:hypothetical protein
MNYSNILQSTQKGKAPGYKPILYFSEVGDIVTWSSPIAIPVLLGDKVVIPTPHTWGVGKAVWKWELAVGSVQAKGTTQGPEGAKLMVHEFTMRVIGDSASTLEQVINMLNDHKVVWFKDADCKNANDFIQLGDDCNHVSVTADFDSKTNSTETVGGYKEYSIVIKSLSKYFYTAALDETV